MSLFYLKIIAMAAMLFDHADKAFGLRAILAQSLAGSSGTLSYQVLFIMLGLIGRVSAPIFFFGIANGYVHTRSRNRYFMRLAAFAALSQIPYTLFYGINVYNTDGELAKANLNILFSLALGILALSFYDRLKEKSLFAAVISVLCLGGLSIVLRTDYTFGALLFILYFYLSSSLSHKGKAAAGALTVLAANLLNLFSPETLWSTLFITLPGQYLGVLAVLFHNGKKGRSIKYAFYLFYPLHLLAIWLIRTVL